MAVELAKPDFTEHGVRGGLIRLYCKVCGVVIGDMVVKGGHRRFERLKNYCELKIKFADRSAHVTNVCSVCLPIATADRQLLMALHDADMDLMNMPPRARAMYRRRTRPRCVATDNKRRGIE